MAGSKRSKQGSSSLTIGGNVSTSGGDIAGGNIEKGDVYQARELNLSTASKLFRPIYETLDKPKKYPEQKREKIKKYVAEIQGEVSKGKKHVDSSYVEKRLINIAKMAPDILEVTLGVIANPVIGLGMLAKKISQKASEKEEKSVKKKLNGVMSIDGDVSSGGGDVASVIYKGINSDELISAFKRAFPKNDPRPEELRNALKELRKHHHKLYEWKELHNALDEILSAFEQFKSEIQQVDAKNTVPQVKSLRNLWRAVSVRVDGLRDFGKRIQFIGVQLEESKEGMQGEQWAVEIIAKRNQISAQLGLGENNFSRPDFSSPDSNFRRLFRLGIKSVWWDDLFDFTNAFNHLIYSQMYLADKKLRESADALYTFSSSVFGR